jgi:hypothetical protein
VVVPVSAPLEVELLSWCQFSAPDLFGSGVLVLRFWCRRSLVWCLDLIFVWIYCGDELQICFGFQLSVSTTDRRWRR